MLQLWRISNLILLKANKSSRSEQPNQFGNYLSWTMMRKGRLSTTKLTLRESSSPRLLRKGMTRSLHGPCERIY
jgi:hypothetical protein